MRREVCGGGKYAAGSMRRREVCGGKYAAAESMRRREVYDAKEGGDKKTATEMCRTKSVRRLDQPSRANRSRDRSDKMSVVLVIILPSTTPTSHRLVTNVPGNGKPLTDQINGEQNRAFVNK